MIFVASVLGTFSTKSTHTRQSRGVFVSSPAPLASQRGRAPNEIATGKGALQRSSQLADESLGVGSTAFPYASIARTRLVRSTWSSMRAGRKLANKAEALRRFPRYNT